MSEFSITIKGFTSKEQIQQFYSWYEGQGEQTACEWFEYRKEEGLLDCKSMLTDMEKIPYFDGNNLTFFIKPR